MLQRGFERQGPKPWVLKNSIGRVIARSKLKNLMILRGGKGRGGGNQIYNWGLTSNNLQLGPILGFWGAEWLGGARREGTRCRTEHLARGRVSRKRPHPSLRTASSAAAARDDEAKCQTRAARGPAAAGRAAGTRGRPRPARCHRRQRGRCSTRACPCPP